jgi:anti-anti-sigma factor
MTSADVRIDSRDGIIVAHVKGEVDLANAEQIGRSLARAIPNHSYSLVVDLSEVDYFDSAGIQLIYQLRELLRSRGQSLRLVIPGGSPAGDALRLAGVPRHIDMTETLSDALRAGAPE